MTRTVFALVTVLAIPLAAQQARPRGNPADTEVWQPVPKIVSPGQGALPPSDAIATLQEPLFRLCRRFDDERDAR